MKLTRAVLVYIRSRSIGKKIWFKTLSSLERSQMNLTIRVVDEVKSSRLANVIAKIVQKLTEALGSVFMKKAWQEGMILAEKLAYAAYSWGNKSALGWAKDRGYALFLGVSSMNALRMVGCAS